MNENTNPFGLSLLSQNLRGPVLDPRGTTNSSPRVTQQSLDNRGLGFVSPTPLGQLRADARILNGAATPAQFLKELDDIKRHSLSTYIRKEFTGPKPANVAASDLTTNDTTFSNRRARRMVLDAAKEFRIDPGLLAEHLVAETSFGLYLRTDLSRGKVSSTALGLDDFVSHRSDINRLVPKASTIRSEPTSPIPAESVVNRQQNKSEPVTDSMMKPQAEFTIENGIRASAAYLKYKEALARNAIGKNEFNALLPEIQFQMTRLLVNPGDTAGRNVPWGTRYWLGALKRGDYHELFDFTDRSASETSADDGHDIPRRATIHTARALHLDAVFFPSQ